MKLLLYDMENRETEFSDGKILSVECENKSYFSKLVSSMKNSGGDTAAIVVGDSKINTEKDCLVIIDYYSIGEMSKSILSKLYKDIEKSQTTDYAISERLSEISYKIAELISEVTSGYNAQFDFIVPGSLTEVLKFVSLAPQKNDDHLQISNYLSVLASLSLYKLIVFVNAKSFFNEAQVGEIAKVCCYNNQKALMIDNYFSNYKLENEKKLLIDDDLYDIIKE